MPYYKNFNTQKKINVTAIAENVSLTDLARKKETSYSYCVLRYTL